MFKILFKKVLIIIQIKNNKSKMNTFNKNYMFNLFFSIIPNKIFFI